MTGLRARKKEKTRDEIVRVAFRLFEKRGFEATSVDHIAAAAGISQRTFFRYFATKEDVAFPREEERREAFRAALRGGGSWEAVRAVILELAREFMAHREQILAEERLVAASPALQARERLHDQRWEAAVAEALGRGAPERVWAAAIVGAMRRVVRDWAAKGGREDLKKRAGQAFELLEKGASSQPGSGTSSESRSRSRSRS